MAGAKLTSPGRKPSFWRTECHPKRFWDAYGDFKGWFKNITGRDWDDRLQNIPYDPQKFRYAAPKFGRPVGALPPEKLPPEWLIEENKEEETGGPTGDTALDDDGKSGRKIPPPQGRFGIPLASLFPGFLSKDNGSETQLQAPFSTG